jgi:hypothetical protein
MAENETDDRSADPGSEYEYGGGTGDFERGEYSPGEGGLEDTDLADDGVLDSSDTLEDPEDPYDDPLDEGIVPADRWSPRQRFGETLEEEREGEPLDQLLAEEEPDVLDDLGVDDVRPTHIHRGQVSGTPEDGDSLFG